MYDYIWYICISVWLESVGRASSGIVLSLVRHRRRSPTLMLKLRRSYTPFCMYNVYQGSVNCCRYPGRPKTMPHNYNTVAESHTRWPYVFCCYYQMIWVYAGKFTMAILLYSPTYSESACWVVSTMEFHATDITMVIWLQHVHKLQQPTGLETLNSIHYSTGIQFICLGKWHGLICGSFLS